MTLRDTASPRFTFPLARAVLDDPAFSPDPRSHPHFPLAHASAYKALPSKSPPSIFRSIPSSPESPESPSSPATSHSQSRGSRTPSPARSPPSSASLPSRVIQRRPPPQQRFFAFPVPDILPKLDGTNIPTRDSSKPVALQNINIPRKGRVKALVRRLTSRHNLDRIDELDETDPFGGSYHHDGPYEAIGGNLLQSPPPCGATPRSGNAHHAKEHESHPSLSRSGRHRSAFGMPSAHGETDLSLNLEPGQILQQTAVYASHGPTAGSAPNQFRPQPNAIPIVTRPDHSRSLSLPNPGARPPEDSVPLEYLDNNRNRPSSFVLPPRERHYRDKTSHISSSLRLHHGHDAAHYVPAETGVTIFPPPRYESRIRLDPPRLPQQTSQTPLSSTSQNLQSPESSLPALSSRDPRHTSAHMPNNVATQSSSGVQNKPLEPPRIRHLPKRLVMPTLLQPQPQHQFLVADAATWQEECLDDYAEDVRFKGWPAMYGQEPRLLRKRSSAFPAKTPIPDHVPMSQNDATPITGSPPTRTTNEGEGTKERTRRRKLSKRKNNV